MFDFPCLPGDCIDRISVLSIKSKMLMDTKVVASLNDELAMLTARVDSEISKLKLDFEAIWSQKLELDRINMEAWIQIENQLAALQTMDHFDIANRAVELQRLNNTRISIKNKINRTCGSPFIEIKSFHVPA